MTIRHALTAAAGNTGPAPTPTDPQFNYVSMLLHGDGTNGAQNNTFVSTPITAPASGYFAGYFAGGSSDYLTVANNAAFDLNTGDYTVEFWFNTRSVTSVTYSILGPWSYPSGWLFQQVNNAINFYGSGGNISGFHTSGAILNANQWTHVAVTRSGSASRMFVNGVLVSSTSVSINSSSSVLGIGINPQGFAQPFNGYLSNVRIVKGTAVYTANFTPPTAPLTAISGTSLLTCMSGFGATFSDLSTNNFTITRFGNTAMTGVATTPPGAAPFSASLPGSPSYVTVGGGMPSGAGTAFTMECWICITDLSGYNAITRGDLSPRLDWGVDTSGSLKLDSVTVANICSSATGVITANTWYHVAVTRSTGNVYKLWANGTNVATSSAFGTSMTANTTIGYSSFSSSHFFKGRISNFRVATSEVYTANFAPPNAPLTAISGTSLLTFQNATFLDNSPNAYSVTANGSATITSSNVLPAITRNGNATQGSLSPYGNLWSNYFDGTGDWLTVPSNSAFDQTGDFTFETWVRVDATVTGTFSNFGNVFSQETPNIFKFGFNKSRQFVVLEAGVGSPALTSATIFAIGVWYHVAVVRSGMSTNNLKLYVNGVQEAQTTKTNSVASANTTFIGREAWSGDPGTLTGAISNLRYVKGTAVYTSAFTPSTTPLTAISGTSLLTCQSNRFIDNSANNFTITRNGDVRVTKEAPFLPTAAYSTSVIGGSAYFDGAGDHLTTGSNQAFEFGTGDWTIEFWINSTQTSRADPIGWNYSFNNAGWAGMILNVSASGQMSWYEQTSQRINATSTGWNNGSWNHIAVTRSGNSVRMFLNGTQQGSTYTTSASYGSSAGMIIGNITDGSGPLNGYISNLRIVKGTAVYTSNFTPPTAPLTAITNTSLLLNFTNAGIFDNAAENDLETVGNAQISTSVKKYGTGSLAFDGTGDWLLAPDSPNIQLGAGTFTIECWVYRTTSGSSRAIAGKGAAITAGWEIGLNSSDLFFFIDGSTVTSSALVPLNTWTHVAVVRTPVSNGTTLYVNGVSSATTTSTTNFNDSGLLYVGAGRTGRLPFTGYIDDLRITKGVARYTANFTPPTAAFPDQ